MVKKKDTSTSILFDKEYFEDGIVTGKSCYQNYQWLPELTIKMAYNIIKILDIEDDTILDYGCAKGYLVKALRILDVKAYGCDISKYAISMIDPDVKKYCKLINKTIPYKTDWVITKDVLEHMREKDIDYFIKESGKKADKCFHVIPLAKDDKYICREYEKDITHITRKPKEWWINKFEKQGWKLKLFDYYARGIKENWTSKYHKGNGFFIFER